MAHPVYQRHRTHPPRLLAPSEPLNRSRSTSEYRLSAPEHHPGAPENDPRASESNPGTSESVQSAPECVPSTQERIPGAWERVPSTPERDPGASESDPSAQKCEIGTSESDFCARESNPGMLFSKPIRFPSRRRAQARAHGMHREWGSALTDAASGPIVPVLFRPAARPCPL